MLADLGQGINDALKGFFAAKDPGEKALNAAIKQITTALLASNVSPRVVLKLRTRVVERLRPENVPAAANRERLVQTVVFEELCRIVDPGVASHTPEKGKQSVVVFVGLQGSGKTTTCCKYALYHKKRGFRVGLVCADTFRAGALDQLSQNAAKIGVPFFGSREETDPVKVSRTGVERFRREGADLIIVDTSGRHTQENDLFAEMGEIIAAVHPDNIVFVVDASIGQAAEVHAKGFKERVDVGSVIVTKIDGTSNVGGALSSVAETGSPISFIGSGEGMEDLDVFSAEGFVGKILGKGDVTGLIDKLEGMDQEGQEEMAERMLRGDFTMGDFHEQYQKILELGPITKLLGMIPGFSNLPIDERMFKKMSTIFGSMTRKELCTDGSPFKETARLVRVSSGSGCSLKEISDTVASYQMMASAMKKFGSNPLLSGMLNADPKNLSVSDKAKMKSQLKSVLPPGLSSMFDGLL